MLSYLNKHDIHTKEAVHNSLSIIITYL